MSCLIWIYVVCKSLLLSPVAVKELSCKMCLFKSVDKYGKVFSCLKVQGEYGILYRDSLPLSTNPRLPEIASVLFKDGDKVIHLYRIWTEDLYGPCQAKTYLYTFDPIKPHFYVVKLGFTRVYIIFLIFDQNIDCGYSLEPP